LTDVHSPEARSRNMRAIKSKNTRPEMILRSGLHRRGLRFRIHPKDLPGKPDLVFPKFGAVIFVHGCFWHGHSCPLFKMPATRVDFWMSKITANQTRDARDAAGLSALGWRVATVWECALKGRGKLPVPTVIDELVKWLHDPQAEAIELRSAIV
jgi:DNA mismatch endonuclease, patch repair protein